MAILDGFVRSRHRLRAAIDYAFAPPEPQLVRAWWGALAGVDLAFVALHLAWQGLEGMGLAGPIPPLFSTFGDVGLSERFNHAKWVGLILLLLLTWRRTRMAGFLALAGIFVLVLLDDALRLHERGSGWIRARWPGMPRLGISASEAGELMVWAMLGLGAVALAVWGARATPRAWWPVMGHIGVAFAGLLFFGVVFDVMQEPLHAIGDPVLRERLLFAAGIVESLGESVFASLALATGIGIHRRHGRALSPAP